MEYSSAASGMPQGRRQSAGFTMVELVITVSIAAVLMAMGVPMYRDIIANNRLTAQTNDLVAAMTLGRSQAITLNQQVVFCRTADAESVATPSCAGTAGSWQYWLLRTAGGAVIRRGEVPNYGSAITVKTTSAVTNDQITFASDGLARTNNVLVAGSGPHIAVCSSHSTTNNKRQITLGAGSRVSTAKASGATCP